MLSHCLYCVSGPAVYLASLVVHPVAALSQVVLLLDVWEHAPTNPHHPQKLVNVIARVPASAQQVKHAEPCAKSTLRDCPVRH